MKQISKLFCIDKLVNILINIYLGNKENDKLPTPPSNHGQGIREIRQAATPEPEEQAEEESGEEGARAGLARRSAGHPRHRRPQEECHTGV